jgi:hypothetical protein
MFIRFVSFRVVLSADSIQFADVQMVANVLDFTSDYGTGTLNSYRQSTGIGGGLTKAPGRQTISPHTDFAKSVQSGAAFPSATTNAFGINFLC